MEEYKNIFSNYLTLFQKEQAVHYALTLVRSKKITIPELYEQIIAPALNAILVCDENKNDLIWQEHLMTNIARTVVENCYTLIGKEDKESVESNYVATVVIVCPEEEYHDIGARMAADMFTLEHYKVFYVGANTPLENVLSICGELKPDILALSVSNFYHISLLKDIVQKVKELANPPYIVASGSSLLRTKITTEEIACDSIIHSYSQIQKLKETIRK